MNEQLSERSKDLVKYMPQAVNALADRLIESLEERLLYGEKPQTNADKYFRNASDEELAERLSKQNFWNCPPHNETCPGYCRECWLDWLKQEANDGED